MRADLRAFFEPASLAIVGASSDGNKLGGRPLRFLLEAGFAGRIVPVNATANEVQGLPAVPNVDAIEGSVEQAILVVPAPAVLAAVHACGRKGIRAVQIFTSGFAELGPDGAAKQQALVDAARGYGMRLLGPNCLGIVSVPNRFLATFSTALEALTPTAGGIGVVSQSGAFGSCIYATAIQRGMGLSRIVATGNEADLDVSDFIEYLAGDAQTRVICLAIEGCRDGARLRTALRAAAAAGKPLIVMKVGSTAAGAAAAATHTGALAGDDRIFDTVFAENGAWRAQSIEEMLDIAQLCAVGPLPPNRRAGIVTLSGGIGVLMADGCGTAGLELPPIPAAAAARIRQLVPFAVQGNPMDTTAQVSAVRDGLVRVLEAMLDETDWGTVFLYLAQKGAAVHLFGPTHALLADMRRRHPERCIVLVGPSDEAVRQGLAQAGLPMLTDPGRAVLAAAGAAHMRARCDAMAAAADPPAAETRGEALGQLDERGAKRLLARHGIAFLEETHCHDVGQAEKAAAACGFPVAMKIVSPDIAHKTEVGGVALGLESAEAVRSAYEAMLERVAAAAPAARLDGVLVAPMLSGGVEMIVGIHRDAAFGPMAMVGMGGTLAELLRDVAFASLPLSAERARTMVSALRCAPLLRGWRGAPALDVDALVRALCSLSDFAMAHGDALSGVEINPLVVRERGVLGLDALIVVRQAGRDPAE